MVGGQHRVADLVLGERERGQRLIRLATGGGDASIETPRGTLRVQNHDRHIRSGI